MGKKPEKNPEKANQNFLLFFCRDQSQDPLTTLPIEKPSQNNAICGQGTRFLWGVGGQGRGICCNRGTGETLGCSAPAIRFFFKSCLPCIVNRHKIVSRHVRGPYLTVLSLRSSFFPPAGAARVSSAKNRELECLRILGYSGLGIRFFLTTRRA